jgi:uncharacterized membrane protein
MTAPATVAWGAHLKWINPRNSHLAFLASATTVYILSGFAIFELIADKLPFIPNRTSPGSLIARVLISAVSGMALCGLPAGPVLGALGGIAGAFAGFHARRYFVKNLHLPDIFVALVEDFIAIGGGFLIVSHA